MAREFDCRLGVRTLAETSVVRTPEKTLPEIKNMGLLGNAEILNISLANHEGKSKCDPRFPFLVPGTHEKHLLDLEIQNFVRT